VRRIARLAVVVALVGAGACSDDDEGAVEATTTTAEATTTSEATTTTTAAPTTTSCAVPAGDDQVGAVDLDGDGVEERWYYVDSGAAVDIFELRRVNGCEEVPVLLDGFPAQFAAGGTVLLLQGVRCEDGVVVHLGATSEDGETYATLDLRYELRDGSLVRVGDRSGQLTVSDPELPDYSTFDC
jgi:hypothetical protein